jgi:hypothetical protein
MDFKERLRRVLEPEEVVKGAACIRAGRVQCALNKLHQGCQAICFTHFFN